MAGGSEDRSAQSTTPERWAEAQVAERSFWETSTYRAEVFSATLAALGEAASWMQQHLPGELPQGDRVELGIGPMGLGCIHLLPRPEGVRLMGVDPLKQTPATDWPLPEPQLSVGRAFQDTYEHVVGRAEERGSMRGAREWPSSTTCSTTSRSRPQCLRRQTGCCAPTACCCLPATRSRWQTSFG
jgi:hypothetical protein